MSRQENPKEFEKLIVPIIVAFIGASALITAALITSGHLLTGNASTNSTPAITTATSGNASTNSTPAITTTTSSNYVELKSFYNGTASGYADGSITFTLVSEDQQGNVSMQTTFQQLQGSQKTATYSCQGSVTLDRHINLQCSNVIDNSYMLTIQAYVYQDGHMEGTEIATNTNDSSYPHVYYWKAY